MHARAVALEVWARPTRVSNMSVQIDMTLHHRPCSNALVPLARVDIVNLGDPCARVDLKKAQLAAVDGFAIHGIRVRRRQLGCFHAHSARRCRIETLRVGLGRRCHGST